MSLYRGFLSSPNGAADRPADPFRIDAEGPLAGLAVGPRVSDLPFPNPVSDHHRLANTLWLLDNNLGGRALLPAEFDDATDAPRFAAVAPGTSDSATASTIYDRMTSNLLSPGGDALPPQNGRVLLAEDAGETTPSKEAPPSGAVPPDDYLHFDGTKLRWWSSEGKLKGQWRAVSGASQFQREQDLSMKDKGPLPPGAWDVRQGQYQALNLRNELAGTLGGVLGQKWGEWPGGSIAWGSRRVWLNPVDGTDTYGRKDFSIHGGSFPGSAGCIDLTGNMDAFAKMFREHGKDMKLYVDYSRE